MKLKLSLLAAVAATALSATAAKADITVAVAGPITGQYAAFGEQMKKGLEQAVADINAAGGVLGQKVKVEVGDDACDPKQAVAVANQLAKAGVKFVAGHFCSGSSIPASQVYAEEGILQISPASTNPKLTEQGLKNVFRVCGRDDQQGVIAGKYLLDNFKGKNIAILHDKSAYGKGLADETQKALNAGGQKEKIYEAYTAGEKDYSALVSKLKQENIQAVYIGGYHTEAGLIARQMKDQGLNAPIISGDALVTNEYWSITGPAGEGTMMTFGPDPREMPEAKGAVEKFRKAGYEPEGYTLYTYAALQVWAQAANAAKSTDAAKVAEVLHKTTFDTAVGKIDFDAKGDLTKPAYVWYRWNNGQYAQVK
ncbi:branched-chain amino acid ABC transporter substrate-binding protein [Azospirillum thermophilum]|uniref:Branched chain amino acid ABC transporter substrate-binding protein n=1 Tax=Azospirillum thermophilum TaxID=2202148 RepID=A0A2S2CX76_9PROT|nr:branched-chain amino acid ABC transporter substrate-binding protein [Azospirillum thermophilum]AWK89079.1 branched chain amino acid ABC transporter substrate-binding protein [Azospirillum thermophilum]